MVNYLLIFIAKIIEVSLMTLRTVLITRGEKVYGAVIGVFEVAIWLVLVSSVLVGIQEDPIRMVVYALGFGVGNLLGSTLEEKLALGLVTINIIVADQDALKIAQILRERNLGVTTIEADGFKEHKKILMAHVKRKRKNEIIKLIENSGINSVISISDTKTVYGGYGLKK
ncbi:DUF2179 domain-containing protein [Clostridium polynesiense]|uniref:DUF2179 domain-containing protein n=1 Tax=Clostridium polynesiense TaxID=1325933 RepID=UPI0009E54A2A|nr:DUF5698 domain-containing protein [Clostridium polynesiense]